MTREYNTCFDCKYHIMSDCYLKCVKHNRINNNQICKDFVKMSELIHYIKLRSSISGCNAKQFECDKYLDCDSCLEDKIKEHDKQIREEVIEEYKNALLKLIKDEQDARYGYLDGMDIREIAEKLKIGVKYEI